MSPFIETFTGRRFQPLAPIVADISIEDVAHHLSNQCRFSGAVRRHYSVAEHSIRVSALLADWGEDADIQMWGLLHDASEAYLVDLPTPLKTHPAIGEGYFAAEKRLMRAVCARFGLPTRQPDRVTLADAVMLATEARDLMAYQPEHWDKLVARPLPERIGQLPIVSTAIEERFLRRFEALEKERAA